MMYLFPVLAAFLCSAYARDRDDNRGGQGDASDRSRGDGSDQGDWRGARVVITSTPSTSTSTTKANVIMVDVQGTSGKFLVYNSALGKSRGIEVSIDALREVDLNGTAVGATTTPPHSINSFSSQNFTISPAQTVSIVSSSRVVNASKISFSSLISSVGRVTIETFVIRNDGWIGPNNKTWLVQAGDLKWNIMLSSWSWCGCVKENKSEVSAFIDVRIKIKSFQQATRFRGSSKIVNLGNITQIQVTDTVIVDNAYQPAPVGYQAVVAEGKQESSLTFRFPKFRYFGMYEPVVLSP
jgi:hypothetical protein